MRELVTGELDAGLCFSPFQHPELVQTRLHAGQLVVVVRQGHPLLEFSGKESLKKLSSYPAAIHKGQPGVELCEAHPVFEKHGVIPSIRFMFDSDECAIEYVLASDSWTMVPDVVAKAFSKQVRPLKLPSDWDAPYFVALVCRNGRQKHPVIQALQGVSELKAFNRQRAP